MFRVSFYWREIDEFTPGGVPTGLTQKLNDQRMMMQGTGGSTPRCVALEGKLGESVGCSIHQNRPSVCREFAASYENGEPHDRCDAARARFGMPPLRPEDWDDPINPPVRPPEPEVA